MGVALATVGTVVHAKAVVLDDMALVGSANVDVRSMLLNFETALAVYDAGSMSGRSCCS